MFQHAVSECGENEEYDACGTECPTNCATRFTCSKQCVAGCFCKEGFVLSSMNSDYRSEPNTPCIPKDQCPIIDPPHRKFIANFNLEITKSNHCANMA